MSENIFAEFKPIESSLDERTKEILNYHLENNLKIDDGYLKEVSPTPSLTISKVDIEPVWDINKYIEPFKEKANTYMMNVPISDATSKIKYGLEFFMNKGLSKEAFLFETINKDIQSTTPSFDSLTGSMKLFGNVNEDVVKKVNEFITKNGR
jgi:hypothetical protein